MCGKFTAMVSWTKLADFAHMPVEAGDGGNHRSIAYRVMDRLPVIGFDREAGKRSIVPRRWGLPDPADWRRPRPIHTRPETIDTMKTFAQAFRDDQRGIVLMKSFNEAPDVEGPTIQRIITPGDQKMLAAAFVWRRFDIPGIAGPLLACVLATVPANRLIATLPTDRMPDFLASQDRETWLGERPAGIDEVKVCLKAVEGVRWTMTREERAKTTRRAKPVVSDPTGLF